MLIGGEKYACEACVRGHRVSNCQHADRQLTHIARKGRPVSQCTHCRTLRKSRSAHVKCDCGEKVHPKGACTHSKEMDSKADTCCCSHGGRCACALKKEHLDPVPESDSDERSSATSPNEARRPRAHTIQSEGCPTVFTNGHHKPAVKHNQMAHKYGLPYVVPRAHSIHGSSPGGLANRSVDNLPHTSTIDALHSDSHIKDSMVSAQQQQRLVKSEHNSPILSSSNFDQLNGQLPQLDLSFSSNDFNVPVSFDGFPAVSDIEIEQPIFSAGLSAGSVDWSHYDGLGFNASFASFSQPPSFTGLDFGSADQPALTTTSTSGEISEAEDLGPIADVNQTRPGLVRQYGSDLENSELGDHDGYRLSTASSHIGMPQVQMLASSDIGSLDIDEFLKGVVPTNPYDSNVAVSNVPATFGEDQKFETSFDDSSYPLGEVEDDGLWMGDFPSSNMVPNNRAGGASELNGWAQ